MCGTHIPLHLSKKDAHLNAWCELAKPLKRKGKFPDTQAGPRLV
jgi:hypothetical protein